MKDPNFIEPKEWYKTLPRKRCGSGVLLFNEREEVLVLKPNYKKNWSIPGGVTESSESPLLTVVRETKEEIGLEIKKPRLLCVDFFVPKGEEVFKGDALIFIFFGGMLGNKEIETINLQELEIEEFKFVSMDEAFLLLKPKMSRRLEKCFEVIKTGAPVYLENGNFPL